MNDKQIKEKIEYLQKTYGTTKQFIASKVGVSRQTISMYCNNKRSLALEVKKRLVAWLTELETMKM